MITPGGVPGWQRNARRIRQSLNRRPSASSRSTAMAWQKPPGTWGSMSICSGAGNRNIPPTPRRLFPAMATSHWSKTNSARWPAGHAPAPGAARGPYGTRGRRTPWPAGRPPGRAAQCRGVSGVVCARARRSPGAGRPASLYYPCPVVTALASQGVVVVGGNSRLTAPYEARRTTVSRPGWAMR
jgi:hypothetical protein